MNNDGTSGAILSPAPQAPFAVLPSEPVLAPASGARRSAVPHRLLRLADALAALTAGVLAGLATGLPIDHAFVIGAYCAVVVPVPAFVCGLYAADDLRSWATGVPDLKRLLFATLALSWPLLILAGLVGAPHPARFTRSAPCSRSPSPRPDGP